MKTLLFLVTILGCLAFAEDKPSIERNVNRKTASFDPSVQVQGITQYYGGAESYRLWDPKFKVVCYGVVGASPMNSSPVGGVAISCLKSEAPN